MFDMQVLLGAAIDNAVSSVGKIVLRSNDQELINKVGMRGSRKFL